MSKSRSLISLASLSLAIGAPAISLAQDQAVPARAPETVVTATRLTETTQVGSSTTIIDRSDIERSPAQSLPDLLRREAGIQVTDLYPGNAAARATIDIRGFGETASRNTLILLNGRRLTDIDLSNVNFAAIPVENIERIEVMRGNGAAVLYGQGAVGGAVNIVTRSRPEPGFRGTAEVALGSDEYRQTSLSASQGWGAYNLTAFANRIRSDGYRVNNDLDQGTLFTELRRQGDANQVFLQLSYDEQTLGLPGGRRVGPTTSELATDRRGTSTPFDEGTRREWAAVAGTVLDIGRDTRLILDAGARRKKQHTDYQFTPGMSFLQDQELDTLSLTPRAETATTFFGRRLDILAGVDLYNHDFDVDTAMPAFAFFTKAAARETSLAGYGQATWALTPTVDASAGLRLHGFRYRVTDDTGTDFEEKDVLTAADMGLAWRTTRTLTLRTRAGRSFRTPTVEERNAVVGNPFELAPQTSWDVEVGAAYDVGGLRLDATAYAMWLSDEIAYDPSAGPFGANANYDKTRRLGIELDGRWSPRSDLDLGATLGLRRSTFESGPFNGNEVPLSAPITASVFATWQATEIVYLSTQANYVSKQRLINDQAATQPEIPSYATVDLKAGLRLSPLNVSATISNLFDEDYFPYGVASTSTPGTYLAYPAPGRTLMVRGALTF